MEKRGVFALVTLVERSCLRHLISNYNHSDSKKMQREREFCALVNEDGDKIRERVVVCFNSDC